MKKMIIFWGVLFSVTIVRARYLLVNVNNGSVDGILPSTFTSIPVGKIQVVVPDDDPNLNNERKYLKWNFSSNSLEVKNQEEKNVTDADLANALLFTNRVMASSRTITLDGIELRAVIGILLDEINVLRQRDNDRLADVVASTSFADLKTRWAVRPVLTERTPAQAKKAYQDKINSGAAD